MDVTPTILLGDLINEYINHREKISRDNVLGNYIYFDISEKSWKKKEKKLRNKISQKFVKELAKNR